MLDEGGGVVGGDFEEGLDFVGDIFFFDLFVEEPAEEALGHVVFFRRWPGA